MDLSTHNGMNVISSEEVDTLDKMVKQALKVRRSIIVYNKTSEVGRLNEACRLCNDLIKLFDELNWR